MDYNCVTPSCTERVTFSGRKCSKHRDTCSQCGVTENYYNIHISNGNLCHNCEWQNRLQKDIQDFICPICSGTQVIRKGNKYACFEGDLLNYRKRKNHKPHGQVYE